MNIITERCLLERKNKDGEIYTFLGPNPTAIFGGGVLVQVNNMGISLVPSTEKNSDGQYKVDDLKRLEEIFPRKDMGDGLARGRWCDPICFEIIRAAKDDAGKPQKQITLYLRTQGASDRDKIHQSCPHDQTTVYKVGWKGNKLEFLNTDDMANRPTAEQQEHARVSSLFDPDLETEAALFGVEWDSSASRETMVELVVQAAMEKKRQQETQAAVAFGEEQKDLTQKRSHERKRNTPVVSGVGADE